ncbi:MAG: DUF1294 domain-containing protein [Hespellia sp.]|nr:DUF1294 domain-containing protein [Hespellia sp.]
MVEYILIYLLVINLLTILIYGDDKARARRGVWRISEATLLFLALIGGSIGALLGMYLFHHKTKHKKFTIGVPMILLAQIAGGVSLYLKQG